MKPTIILAFLLLPLSVFSQTDSLLNIIKTDSPDSVKAKIYSKIAYITSNIDTCQKYAQLSLQYCKDKDLNIKANNYAYLGYSYYMKSEFRSSLQSYFKATDFYNKISKKKLEANSLLCIGNCYKYLNISDSIFFYHNAALKKFIEIKDTSFISYTYQVIGEAYNGLGLKSSAEENYKKSLEYAESSKDTLRMAFAYSSIAWNSGDSPSSIEMLKKSISLFERTPEIEGKKVAYYNLARKYMNIAESIGDKAYADSSYMYIEKVGNHDLINGEITNYILDRFIYVDYFVFYKKYHEALAELLRLEKYFDDNISIIHLRNYHKHLHKVYSCLGDYKNALKHHEKYTEYKLKSFNDSTFKSFKDAEVERTRMLENVKREAAEKLHREETRHMRLIIMALIIGLVLIFWIFWNKKKANKILSEKNIILNNQKVEIEAQRDEILTQRNEIEYQRNEILSSINYARRIQRAAVSSEDDVREVFPDSFVFYRPRDIVSGDFYRSGKCGKYAVMITADCTGHGIPGAFLSMLGLSALKEFMTTEYDAANPGIVLDRLRDFIKTTLISSEDGTDVTDGMDMTVCCYDFKAMEMRYAIAEQTMVIIRKGEVIKLKGDIMPVGRHLVEKEHFQTKTVKIEKGDMVYTFSDGIQDQFGKGSEMKKFSSKQLFAVLTSLAEQPVEEQCQILEQTILDWRGNTPQVDDMTLVGIRV